MQAVIIGSTGGIGSALTAQLAERDTVDAVHAVSRTGAGGGGKVVAHRADLFDEDSLEDLANAIKAQGAPSLVIVATGLLSDGAVQPEKSFRQQSLDAFEQVFRVNTFAPALLAKHMIPIMPRKERAVFAALSARVGSISDNGIGGWHAYRASKAALNMLIQNYAIEQARRSDAFICVGLHPGTVDTGLSKPFQSNVPDKKLFSPDQSAAYLLSVIDGLDPSDSGKVFDWAGKVIPA